MHQDYFFAQIPDYLDGHLSEHDQMAFERRLAGDEALAREVALHREVQQVLGNRKVHDFRQKLEAINATAKVAAGDIRPGPVNSRRRLFAVAAGLAVLVIAGLWWFSEPGSPQDVLAAHLQNFDPASVLHPEYTNKRSLDSSASVVMLEKTLQDSARIFFSDKKYEAALALMQQVSLEEVANPSTYYYELGILYLLNRQPAPAIVAHQKMENDLSGGKYWYLALSHLQLGQTHACREQLSKLTDMKSPWSNDAKKLLRKLR